MRGRGPGNEARDEPEIYVVSCPARAPRERVGSEDETKIYGRPCRLLALFTVNFRWPVVYSNLQSSLLSAHLIG